jgi:hypothetical protein
LPLLVGLKLKADCNWAIEMYKAALELAWFDQVVSCQHKGSYRL